MTSEPRFERQLPAILEELYLGPTPEYRDEVLSTAVRTRQRPPWTFAGRWLPMADIAGRPMLAPRVPWRVLGVALLVIALLLAAALVYVGARHTKVPPPFGPAENGLLAYAENGDIFTLDPTTGRSTAVTSGPDIDTLPQFSPDGGRIAFNRSARVHAGPPDSIVVAEADGAHPVVVNAAPLPGGIGRVEWSPDGGTLLVGADDDTAIWLFDAAEHRQPRRLAEKAYAYIHPYRPPDGRQLLINRDTAMGPELLVLDPSTGHETVLASAVVNDDLGAARWSPDGSKVVYNAQPQNEQVSQRLFVVNADGTGRHQVTDGPGVWYDIDPAWSPDGTRIAYTRYEQGASGGWGIRPIGIASVADGTVQSVGPTPLDVRRQRPTPDDSKATPGEGWFFDWSPDGTSLLAFPSEASGHAIIIDAKSGSWRLLDPAFDSSGFPVAQSWQRKAP